MPHAVPNASADWRLTDHARRRARQRGISTAAMLAVLAHPQVTYPQNSYGHGRQVRQGGELGVVVDPATRTVITVVFRDLRAWMRHLRHGGMA